MELGLIELGLMGLRSNGTRTKKYFSRANFHISNGKSGFNNSILAEITNNMFK